MDTVWDILVVGGGPAGYTAGLYAARAGLSVLVLAGPEPGGQLATAETVENYPGLGAVDGMELAERMRRDAERSGVVVRPERVTALDLGGMEKLVETPGGRYKSRALVYAAGASPRTLDVPGEAALRGRGVSFCAACDGMFFRDRTVAVVGGGNSAVAEAVTLARLCRRVILVHRRSGLRAEQSLRETLERAENVDFLWNARVEAVEGRTAVTGLRYTDLSSGAVRTLDCDGVFVAVGRVPNTDLLRGRLPLDGGGYVLADETTRTELDGVFAAGDVRAKELRQIVTAAADGAMAAYQAARYLEQ